MNCNWVSGTLRFIIIISCLYIFEIVHGEKKSPNMSFKNIERNEKKNHQDIFTMLWDMFYPVEMLWKKTNKKGNKNS